MAPLPDAFVECVWFLSTAPEDVSAPDAVRLPERILPDGCIELICHLGEPFIAASPAGLRTPQPACFVVGMLTSPLLVEPANGAETIGVRFRPGGAYPFFPCRLSTFTDRVVKALGRILRFQNTLRRRASLECAADSRIDWVRIAVECGYSDQSHLIHDYAVFAGETPACLLAAESELSAYFTAPQRLAALFGERR